MKQAFTKALVDQILAGDRDKSRARIFESNTQRPFGVQKLTLDLSTAKLETDPFVVNFPFRTFFVQTASDNSVEVNFKPVTRDSYQSFFPVKKNDVWSADYPISAAFLHWSAQSGKSITLVFFVDSEFRSGSQISVNSGGVSINDGSSFEAQTRVTLVATTAAIIAPANSDRKLCLIENNTGADLFIGSATVTNSGATRGIRLAAGDVLEWRNTAALYGYSVAGGDVHYLDQE